MVYIVNEWSDGKERLLYDFGLEIGDVFTFVGDEPLILFSVDTINLAGVPVRRMKFVSEEDVPYINPNADLDENNGMAKCWVEGIGSLHGPANPLGWNVIGAITHMDKCIYEGQVIFKYNDFTTAISTAISTQNTMQQELQAYDLHGQKHFSTLFKGIYIRNGKKFVVK